MRIGIDIDGVLADFMTPAKDIAERVTHRLIEGPALDWNWTNWKLTDLQLVEVWDHIKETPNFWLSLGRLPGANPSDLIHLDQKHTLVFITTRVPTAGLTTEKQTAYWLSHKMGVCLPTVIVSWYKGRVAQALELDCFIDDKPENLANVSAGRPECKLYLLDQSYNQKEKRFERVNTFEDFAKKYAAD